MEKIDNFINNSLKGTSSYADLFDPAKDEVLGKVALSQKEDVRRAVEAANEAFKIWSKIPVGERIKCLWKLKILIEKNSERFAELISLNVGKTKLEGRGEVARAVENVEAAVGLAYFLGRKIDKLYRDIDEEVIRVPLGSFACITPFNFPLMIPFWFLPYALILGNTVIIKPSEITPLVYTLFYKILEQTKIPEGTINILHGGKETVSELLSSDVKGIAFVGSTPVAKLVYQQATKENKRVLAQGGAKNHVVILPDADLKKSIEGAVSSVFGMAGQRCLANSVVICMEKNYEKIEKGIVEAAKKIRVGHMLDPRTEMGPLVTKKALERVLEYIKIGVEEGAELLLDGRKKVPGYEKGYFLFPSIFRKVAPEMKIWKEEIFGPVLLLMKVKNFDEAIELIAKSRYGNAASIFTSGGRAAREFVEKVNAGNIGINIGVAQPSSFFPFGGTRDSFFGILHGQVDALDFFTDRKVIIKRWF